MNFKIEKMLTVVDRRGGGLKGLGVTDSLWHLQVASGACRLFGGPANVEQGFAVALAYACTCGHVRAWGQAPACTVRFGGCVLVASQEFTREPGIALLSESTESGLWTLA